MMAVYVCLGTDVVAGDESYLYGFLSNISTIFSIYVCAHATMDTYDTKPNSAQ